MSIFHTNHRSDSALSRYIDGEMTPSEQTTFSHVISTESDLSDRYQTLQFISETARTPVSEATVEDAQDRVWHRLRASIAEGAGMTGRTAAYHGSLQDESAPTYGTANTWWQRSVALPLPVIAAASALFLVMAVGLILNPGVLSNQYRTVAELGSNAPVNVQVQVNGNESDMLLKWLEEQNQVGNVTIQLPETAEFQLRGKPVLMRPESHGDEGNEEFEIVPMEVPTE